MLNKHPKGLLTVVLINMCVCFGFYFLTINLILSLETKFTHSNIWLFYSIFYSSIFIFSIVGGLIADKKRNHKGIVFVGLILMTIGFFIIAIPTPVSAHIVFWVITCLGLLVIVLGRGLISGNIQAVIGQMYDNPEYSKI